MPLSLEDIKLYLRVDDDAEDALILAQLAAAESYIKGKISKTQRLSGGEPLRLEDDPLYQQCVKLMVAHWYENRTISAVGTTVIGFKHAVDAILAHIEGCGDYL
ncbi:head-tail connector protein [Cloacibacillus evryensis]|uniref:head-tail connector protein n=1 Tax=Cloacibacillus evryensis TaxID=508460 RepID=UPI0021099A69|nr:head-tail connector protein [Cloacibacillus evryensis]MCQ4763232.1 head-tail connector protein [Cloacibacillus evryensis]